MTDFYRCCQCGWLCDTEDGKPRDHRGDEECPRCRERWTFEEVPYSEHAEAMQVQMKEAYRGSPHATIDRLTKERDEALGEVDRLKTLAGHLKALVAECDLERTEMATEICRLNNLELSKDVEAELAEVRVWWHDDVERLREQLFRTVRERDEARAEVELNDRMLRQALRERDGARSQLYESRKSIEKMDDLHSRATEAILLALGDAGATEPTDEPETWRYVPIAERVKRVVEERDEARATLANLANAVPMSVLLRAIDERDEARAALWDLSYDVALRSQEAESREAELEAICEALDNAPVPSTNTDRTPSTLAERVEWLVWAWQEAESMGWIPVEERLPEDGQPCAIRWVAPCTFVHDPGARYYAATYRAPDEWRDYPIWGGWSAVYAHEYVTHWLEFLPMEGQSGQLTRKGEARE